MEWTREKTLALINEYRKRKGLWDMTHDDYRKKEIKQKLLVEVSTNLGGGIPIVEIEKKFHTLRTQYHREINRMKRKEPYNSKWFGFKNLQFLSSPKACRSNKGRIKTEINENGVVRRKYINSSQHEGSISNLNDEYLNLHRKSNVSYDANGTSGNNRELEKLIEETTKDVDDDAEDPKPKMGLKEIALSHHSYSAQLHTGSASDLSAGENDPLQHNDDNNQSQDEQPMDEDEEPIETIDIQPIDEDPFIGNSSGGRHLTPGSSHHRQPMPTRIIKIQHQDSLPDEEYYDDEGAYHPRNNSNKRYYYENQTQNSFPTSTPNVAAQSKLLNPTTKFRQLQRRSTLQLPAASMQPRRDDCSTYGEYVANEMRYIKNREVLMALKHKINTAIFEASLAEIQK